MTLRVIQRAYEPDALAMFHNWGVPVRSSPAGKGSLSSPGEKLSETVDKQAEEVFTATQRHDQQPCEEWLTIHGKTTAAATCARKGKTLYFGNSHCKI